MDIKGPVLQTLKDDPGPIDPEAIALSQIVPRSLRSEGVAQLQKSALKFLEINGRLPQEQDWKDITKQVDLKKIVGDVAKVTNQPPRVQMQDSKALKKEAKIDGMLMYLVDNHPSALNNVLFRTASISSNKKEGINSVHFNTSKLYALMAPLNFDPLANFDPTSQLAVLSPIGIIDLYREYFFELGSFLGPPVGHVWVSLGSSLELFEIHTRRTVQEKQIETAIETTTKSETETTDDDELSTAVSQENSRNIKFGISASGGANFGNSNVATIQIRAEANFGIDFNTKKSQEEAHKHSRSQSERLANEIRKSYKTTFRTSVETEDTSSRRYVIQNSTDKTVNFELKRKMRQVAVQVQHIGKQLCWQVFVDDPGTTLGIGQLVHVAQPEDLNPDPPPTDMIPPLHVEKKPYFVTFGFNPVPGTTAEDDGADEDYAITQDGIHAVDIHEDTALITAYMSIDGRSEIPGDGYTLEAVNILGYNATGDGDDEWYCTPEIRDIVKEGKFGLALNTVNFDDNSGIAFQLELVWDPPATTPSTDKSKVTEEQEKIQHTAAIKIIKERIKLASNISIRPTKDLREEERTIIYRKLIKMLTSVESLSSTQYHLMTELIRSIFDVDNMLYFVAPEWWHPRARQWTPQDVKIKQYRLTAEDSVTWGGEKSYVGGMKLNYERPNYYITEDSEPARMGSSLGWLLQLDGDAHRNVFLNAPWVRAVIPVRPGREKAAINWLKLADIEGIDGLPATYGGNDLELDPNHNTIEDALDKLAEIISAMNTDIKKTLATETVFETGFDPLEGGFRASGIPFETKPFDQWIEILPTDQLVAVEYKIPQE